VAFSLLGYFVSMIMVLTAAVGVMIGLFNFSTSENVRHYPRPALERNVTAISGEPRLFMVAPDTKDASPAKNVEAGSAVAPAEKAEAKKSKAASPRCSPVSAITTSDLAGMGSAMPKNRGTGKEAYFLIGEYSHRQRPIKKEAAVRKQTATSLSTQSL
jgi:hypothetical protein